jgi:hypothetical protein
VTASDEITTYKLPTRVFVNSLGPFFYDRDFTTGKCHDVGGFRGSTRPAQVLMLLHELAHATYRDGQPLTANDAGHANLAHENTEEVAKVCKSSIR